MNILLICDEYPPGRHGGIGSAVKLQANAIAAIGHNVYVAGLYEWGYGEDDYFEDGKVKVYRHRMGLARTLFKKQDSFLVRAIYKLFHISGIFHWDIKRSLKKYKNEIEALIKEHEIDIIEMPDFNNYRRYVKSYIAPVQFSVPTIVKIHGSLTYIAKENKTHVADYVQQMERDMFLEADAICSVSKYGGALAMKHLEVNRDYHVLHNGIDTKLLTPVANKDENKVVFSGTLNANKGIYQLIKAWNKVIDGNPNAQLYVYGKGPINKIKALLEKRALDTVHFAGHIDHKTLFESLGTAAVCIFPSYAENFALAPMEAMASGAAVIYTKRASGKELITDGVDGVLIDPDDTNEIAESILRLLSDSSYRARIAEAGEKTVMQNFDMSVVAKKHIEYYTTILNRK